MNDFSDREMYEQAASNPVAVLVAADQFLRDRDIDASQLYRFFGESYASEWDDRKGDIERTAQSVALNMTSAGFESPITTAQSDVIVHARWTEQHDGSDWPTTVKPALERAIPLRFGGPMAHAGVKMTASPSADGIDLRLAAPKED